MRKTFSMEAMSLSLLRITKSPTPRSIFPLCTRLFFSSYSPQTIFPDNPTCAYYDDLVNAAGRDRDFHALRHLLNKRIRDGCFNTTDTFKFLSEAALSAGRRYSTTLLDDVVETLSRLDPGLPRKSACDSLVARLSRLNLLEEPLRVIEVMARGEYGLDASSFHPVLRNLCKKRKLEDAWRVVEVMTAYGVAPDVTALNYLLTAYCYVGDVKGASEVLRRIEEGGLGADARTYDALVLGACRAGKVEGAIMLMRKMVDDGVVALNSTHAHVISALLDEGYFGQAVKFVLAFAGRDGKLDTESFGVLGNKLVKMGRGEEAKLVLEEMDKTGLVMADKLRRYCEFSVLLK